MYRKHAPLLVTIFLLCGLEFLQTGMIAFATLPIMGAIGAGPEEYSLVIALYACMAVIAIATQRWLTERLGWRNTMLGSAAVYIVGALVCGTSEHLLPFTIGRLVMGLGGGAFMTSGRILVDFLAPGRERFTGIKVFATALVCATAGSPLLASIAVANDDWHAIFWILIGMAVLTCVMAIAILPTQRIAVEVRTSTSAARFTLLAAAALALMVAIQRAPYELYSSAPAWIGWTACGAVLLVVFFHVEHQHERPLLRVRALLAPRYVVGVALFSVCYFVLGANGYMLPFYLQRGLGYSLETIGLYLSAGLVAAVATWLVMSRLLPRSPGPRKYWIAGFLALALFGYRLSCLSPDVDMIGGILPALALNGCFVMLVLPATAMQTFRDVPANETLMAHAQQVKSIVAQIATAAGAVVSTVAMQWRSTVQYASLNVHLSPDDPLFQQQLAAAGQAFSRTAGAMEGAQMAMAQQAQEIARQATLLASGDYFRMLAIVAMVAVAISATQRVFK